MNLLDSKVILVLCAAFTITVSGQTVDLENFKGLQSSGQLPDDFLRSWGDKYQESLKVRDVSNMKRREANELEEFWQQQHRQIDMMLQSGQFAFGDPLSQYLNKIADEVLKDDPELRKKIRVYTFKSPSVNAFAVADGIIGVHVGLIAHVRSEAELAYVIAHEISHYTEQHMYDRFKQKKELNDGWSGSGMNAIKRFDELTARSKEHELEADKNGVVLYLKSQYHPAAIDTALTTLHESYITYGRKEVGPDFLAAGDFVIPEVFYRSEVDAVSKEEDYFDQTHNHPNVATRREALKPTVGAASAEGKKFFIQPEAEFEAMQKLARFEAVREKVLYGHYGDALYDIYVLEDKYPNNRFLEISKVRTLFGLASFKAVDKISDVTASGYHVEGPMQQVFHIIKQFNNQQLVSTALYHALTAKAKYPDAKILDEYITYLNRYMLAYCDLEAKDFKVDAPKIAAFDKTVEDFPSERHYLRAKQMHYRDFYRYLLNEQYQSGWLAEKMEEHRQFKDSLDVEDYLTAEQREERYEAKQERLEEHGADLNIRKMIVLDPTIMVINASDDTDEQLEALEQEENYKAMLPQWVKAAGIEPELLYVENMKATDINDYNVFSGLEEWIKEARMYRSREIIPIDLDISEKIHAPARYVCRIMGYIAFGKQDYYYFGIYDLEKGEVVYERSENVGRKLSMRDLEKETQIDLERVFN
ncbi:MAG: M48 family metallopeptidase [Owenweeksia sp.]